MKTALTHSADLTAQFEALRINELTFDHVYAHDYANSLFLIEDLYLRRQQQWLDLTFSLDTVRLRLSRLLIKVRRSLRYNSLLLAGGQLSLRMSISVTLTTITATLLYTVTRSDNPPTFITVTLRQAR